MTYTCVYVCVCNVYCSLYDTIFILIKMIFHFLQQAIPLEWRILTRDCVIYVISVTVLVIVMWDGIIQLYEAIILMVLFISYLTILFSSKCIVRWHNKLAHLYICKTRSTNLTEEESKFHYIIEGFLSYNIISMLTSIDLLKIPKHLSTLHKLSVYIIFSLSKFCVSFSRQISICNVYVAYIEKYKNIILYIFYI